MAEAGVTKKVLAYALKRLMASHPLSKITVGDICEACDMNRKSFYYHFRDKYDLVNWIFYTEFFDEFHKDEPEGPDALLRLCEFFQKRQDFYRNALLPRGQDSFYEYLGQVLAPLIAERLAPYFATDPYREFYTDLTMHIYRDAIVRWVMDRCEIPAETFVRLMYRAATVLGKIVPANP